MPRILEGGSLPGKWFPLHLNISSDTTDERVTDIMVREPNAHDVVSWRSVFTGATIGLNYYVISFLNNLFSMPLSPNTPHFSALRYDWLKQPHIVYNKSFSSHQLLVLSLLTIQGRGQPLIRHAGNINFRRLCYKRQAHYLSVHRNAQKDNIARSIVVEVKRRGGRFLRRFSSKKGEPRVDAALGWIEIDDASATEKVKQTI